jgi:DNA-binding winged helix-turn-helix (wHTH) protein/tetratricopeptide (TPR) repeat protein
VIFAFGDVELDTTAWKVRRAGSVVPLQRKAFEVLRYLIEHRDRPVSREELLKEVWAGDAVTPAVLTVAVSKVRQALAQGSSASEPIETEHGRGYRFVGRVRVVQPAAPLPPPVPIAHAAVSVPRSPFVGRDAVMDVLVAALDRARAGHGSLCLLVGEPGVGKTRTAEELAARAESLGVSAWWGRSHESEGMPAFWPWTQVLRRWTEGLSAARLAELGPSVHEVAKLVPELGGGASDAGVRADGIEIEAAQFRIFDAVTRALRLASAERPRLVILDDLHWGDGPTIDLLGYLLPEIVAAPILIVGTLRDTELPAGHPTRAGLEHLIRNANCHYLPLARLNAEDVERYATELFGRPVPGLGRAVFAQTEGNAFLMTEVLRPLASRPGGVSERDAQLPEPAFDLVRRRIRALDARTQEVLAAAAILGRRFDLPRLSRVCDLEPGALLAAIEAPLASRLIEGSGARPQRFTFGHALFQQTLVDDLPLAERARLHRRAAEALEEARAGGAEVSPQELAHHFVASLPDGPADKALAWSREAAEAAMRVFAYREAARQYARALEALEYLGAADLGLRAELQIALGHAQRLGGRVGRARATFTSVLELARRAGRPSEVALAAIGLRSLQPMRAVPEPETIQALTEALMVLPDAEAGLRARVLSRLAGQRSMDTRRLMSQRAAEIAAGIEDPTTLHDVLAARLHATQGPDVFDERLALAEQIVALADAQAQPYWKWEAFVARYDVALRRSDARDAARWLEACGHLAEELRHPPLLLEVERLRLQRRLARGELDKLGDAIVAQSELGERLQNPFAQFNFFVQSATYFRDLGVMGPPSEVSEEFISRFPWVEQNARAQVALHTFEAGHLDAARKSYDYFARRRFENVNRGEDWLFVVAQLSPVAVGLGEREDAEQLRAWLVPHAGQSVMSSAFIEHGSAHHYLGTLARFLGDADAARMHFEAALVVDGRMERAAWLGRTRIAYARLLRETGDDAARATALLREARDDARRRGMQAIARDAEALLG